MDLALAGMLQSVAEQGDWASSALCAETDPEIFFPEKGQSPKLAQSVCRNCPVRQECLSHALDTHEGFGIWGGVTALKRQILSKEMEAQNLTAEQVAKSFIAQDC